MFLVRLDSLRLMREMGGWVVGWLGWVREFRNSSPAVGRVLPLLKTIDTFCKAEPGRLNN